MTPIAMNRATLMEVIDLIGYGDDVDYHEIQQKLLVSPDDVKLREHLAISMVRLICGFVFRRYKYKAPYQFDDILSYAVGHSWVIALAYDPKIAKPSTFWTTSLKRLCYQFVQDIERRPVRLPVNLVWLRYELNRLNPRWVESIEQAVATQALATPERQVSLKHLAALRRVEAAGRLSTSYQQEEINNSENLLTSSDNPLVSLISQEVAEAILVRMLESIERYGTRPESSAVDFQTLLLRRMCKVTADVIAQEQGVSKQRIHQKYKRACELSLRWLNEPGAIEWLETQLGVSLDGCDIETLQTQMVHAVSMQKHGLELDESTWVNRILQLSQAHRRQQELVTA